MTLQQRSPRNATLTHDSSRIEELDGASQQHDGRSLETPESSGEWLSRVVARATLTPAGLKLARYISASPQMVSFASAAEIADRTDLSAATVVRFAQRLGFAGWSDFQISYRHRYYFGIRSPTKLLHDRTGVGSTSRYRAAIAQDIENLRTTLTTVADADVQEFARFVSKANKTLVLASGSYVSVGQVLVHLGTFMGYQMALESRGGASTVAELSQLTTSDCVVVVSFWRLVKREILAAQYCHKQKIPVLAIVDSRFSPLFDLANVSLVIPTEGVAFFQSVTASISVVYGVLSTLYDMGGAHVSDNLGRAEKLFSDLDILYG